MGDMDLETLQLNLQKAEEQIATGIELLGRQEQVVADLERDGHDAAMALAVLKTMERSLALQVAAMEQLSDELADAKLERARNLRTC
ncbi:MAG: hypothetical protein J0H44_02290 [Alphaproteobacteria bacterium]|nr:hypothetical protein [Alphaproteobacteria bacterium]